MSDLARFELRERGPVVIAEVSGELDMSNALDLERSIEVGVPGTARGVVIDLTAVEFLDSSAVSAIFSVARRLADRRQTVRLVVTEGSPIRRVIELVSLPSVAPVDAELEPAIEAVSSSPGR